MPRPVLFVLMIECAFIVLTTLLLAQPSWFVPSKSPRALKMMQWVGSLLLCVTFCWSVILGIVLSLHRLVLAS